MKSASRQTTFSSSPDDTQWLQQIAWDRTATPEIAAAARSGQIDRFLQAWRLNRPSRKPRDERYAAWSAEALADENSLPGLDRLLTPPALRRGAIKPAPVRSGHLELLAQSLAEVAPTRTPTLLERLVTLELLTRFIRSLPDGLLWPLYRWTFPAGEESAPETISATEATDIATDVAAVRAECELLSGIVYEGVAGMAARAKQAKKTLARGLVSETDSDGTPHAEQIPRLAFWLAPFVRLIALEEAGYPAPFADDFKEHLTNALEVSAGLCHGSGRLALSQSSALPLFQTAARVLNVPDGSPVRKVALTTIQAAAKAAQQEDVLPSSQSDWAHVAMLRSGWGEQADVCTLTYHRPWPDLDLSSGGRTLLHGPWKVQAKVATGDIELADQWSCVCWNADSDADYLELQMAGPQRLTLERSAMLSRGKQYLVLADCLRNCPKGAGEIRISLPFGKGLTAVRDTLTREVMLRSGSKTVARIFPLALPQDTVQGTAHSLEIVADELVITYQNERKAIFSPLVIVWKPELLRRQAIWRTLTVTESSKIVSPDIATGHRLQLGDFQILVYRSLVPCEYPRAVLGHHTAKETLIGEMTATGDITPILLVE